jgi:hypothetical protein
LRRATVAIQFFVLLSPNNNGGVFMHHTTLLVLVLLVFGQLFVLGSAGVFLWLAGEFGDPPSWRVLLRRFKRWSDNAQHVAGVGASGKQNDMLPPIALAPDLIGAGDCDCDGRSIARDVADVGARRGPISVS